MFNQPQPDYSFSDARKALSSCPQGEAVAAGLLIHDRVVGDRRASMELSEAMAIADADLQVTLAALCLLSQGPRPIFDARLVYADSRGGSRVIERMPAEGEPFVDPTTGESVEDPASRITFRFDVRVSLMARGA